MPDVNGSGRRAGHHGIDKDEFVSALPGLNQFQRVAGHFDRVKRLSSQSLRYDHAGGIIAALRIAETDNPHGSLPVTLHDDPQEVRSTRNAGIVIAHGLLALPRGL